MARQVHATIAALKEYGIIPVVRLPTLQLAHDAVVALKEAGFAVFEITLSVPSATRLISDLSKEAGVLVGAGTVLSLEQAEACLEAGAQYIVSPCIVDGLPQLCRRAKVPCIMNGLTPAEVLWVRDSGAEAVKVFPISSMGAVSHLRALRSIFPELEFVPTGGINLENMADYFRAGAAFVSAGSDLINQFDLQQGYIDKVTQRGRLYLRTFQELRNA